MIKRHFDLGHGKKNAGQQSRDRAEIKQQIGNTVFKGILSGELKPPKLKGESELKVMSKRQEGIAEALRRDFGLKSKKTRAPGGMRKQMH